MRDIIIVFFAVICVLMLSACEQKVDPDTYRTVMQEAARQAVDESRVLEIKGNCFEGSEFVETMQAINEMYDMDKIVTVRIINNKFYSSMDTLKNED